MTRDGILGTSITPGFRIKCPTGLRTAAQEAPSLLPLPARLRTRRRGVARARAEARQKELARGDPGYQGWEQDDEEQQRRRRLEGEE